MYMSLYSENVGHCAILRVKPQDIITYSGGTTVLVAGSVIQLFCSASGQFTAPHMQWTRNNITIPETAQLPHLMVKSRTENNTITSSVLTIYGFSTSDNGSYYCCALDSDGSDVSQPLLLTGKNSHGFDAQSNQPITLQRPMVPNC